MPKLRTKFYTKMIAPATGIFAFYMQSNRYHKFLFLDESQSIYEENYPMDWSFLDALSECQPMVNLPEEISSQVDFIEKILEEKRNELLKNYRKKYTQQDKNIEKIKGELRKTIKLFFHPQNRTITQYAQIYFKDMIKQAQSNLDSTVQEFLNITMTDVIRKEYSDFMKEIDGKLEASSPPEEPAEFLRAIQEFQGILKTRTDEFTEYSSKLLKLEDIKLLLNSMIIIEGGE